MAAVGLSWAGMQRAETVSVLNVWRIGTLKPGGL